MKLPSVTQCFGHYLSGIPEYKLEIAADRGTRAHTLCFKHLRRAHIMKIDPDCAGYFLSFTQWAELMVKEVIFIEEEFVDENHGYMGHPDMGVVLKDGSCALIDLKTPLALQKIWAGQIAAYLNLIKHKYPPIKKGGSLRLSPDGRMAKMKWYEDSANDLAAFISLLNGYRYFFWSNK